MQRFGRKCGRNSSNISYHGWSLASDKVGPEKTCVNAKTTCQNRRENEQVLEK